MNDEIIELIRQIFRTSERLSSLTGRPFTPDGHMIGSIGELYAQEYYGVGLYRPGHKGHDGVWSGREVQIKATQRTSVDLKGPSDLLLVLRISPDGSYEEIYNGDGKRPWQSLAHRKISSMGEISISVRQLRELNTTAAEEDRMSLKKN
jgi:hypothetical protein